MCLLTCVWLCVCKVSLSLDHLSSDSLRAKQKQPITRSAKARQTLPEKIKWNRTDPHHVHAFLNCIHGHAFLNCGLHFSKWWWLERKYSDTAFHAHHFSWVKNVPKKHIHTTERCIHILKIKWRRRRQNSSLSWRYITFPHRFGLVSSSYDSPLESPCFFLLNFWFRVCVRMIFANGTCQ